MFTEGLSHTKGCYIIYWVWPKADTETWTRLKYAKPVKKPTR